MRRRVARDDRRRQLALVAEKAELSRPASKRHKRRRLRRLWMSIREGRGCQKGDYSPQSFMLNTGNEEKNTVLCIFCLFREFMYLEYVRIHVIYRVNQAEYVIYILVVVP